MPDKLTDSKIPDIKELLEYKVKVGCQNCDLIGKGCCSTCVNSLIKSFIGIFDRLQAENERLKEEKSKIENKIDEIYPLVMQLPNAMQQAKASAYKEFAEKLYEELRMYGIKDKFNKVVFLNLVDKAKKELEEK